MPRKCLAKGAAIEFIPVQQTVIIDDLEVRKTDGTALAPSFVLMEYLDGRHYGTQVYTMMEMRAMVMLTNQGVDPEFVDFSVCAAKKYSKEKAGDGYYGGAAGFMIRDFAYRLDEGKIEGGKWEYGAERDDPINLRGFHPRSYESARHPFLLKHRDASHAYLAVESDIANHEITDIFLRLSINPPKHPGKCVRIPLGGREAFREAVLEAMDSSARIRGPIKVPPA